MAISETVRAMTTHPDPSAPPVAGSVVVGFDASSAGHVALEWARHHTGAIGPLVVVGCWDHRRWDVTKVRRSEHAASERLRAALAVALDEEASPGADAAHGSAEAPRTVVLRGEAGPTLVELSTGARLLVVGSRGRGAIVGSILGSTSAHCAHHATVPVAIVPSAIDPRAPVQEVTVGVDGSASSIAALRWALQSTPVEAIIDIHFAWMTEPLARTLTSAELERVRSASAGFLDAVVDRVVAEEEAWTRTTRRHLSIGAPFEVLDTTEASMIVVGTRSEQGVAAMLLDSPADALAHGAHAVLVLVPPPPGLNEGVRHVG